MYQLPCLLLQWIISPRLAWDAPCSQLLRQPRLSQHSQSNVWKSNSIESLSVKQIELLCEFDFQNQQIELKPNLIH